MQNLDDIEAIHTLDKSNMYGSVEALAKQCQHAWDALSDFTVPEDYKDVQQIIMTGMGGSGLAARIIDSVFGLTLRVPLIHIHDYDLPAWAGKQTLVLCSTFSGETEESVQTARQAQERGCKWMSIGSGGTIIELAKKYNRPYYQIDPVYNPSKQPRMANGYSVIGQLLMVSKTGLFSINEEDIQSLIKAMQRILKKNAVVVPRGSNSAKQLAMALQEKVVVLFAARHLVGSAHLIKNQLNENSKNFSVLFDLPELNHHLLEGFGFPKSNGNNLFVLLGESNLYPERIRKRFAITREILKKYGVSSGTWEASADDVLSQAFEFVQFGSLVNFYLSVLNNLDAAAIPWVDYFKTQLGQSLGKWK